jgi:hypothetical protein
MRFLQNISTPLRGTILAATALCATAFAQSGLTTIQDTLFKADGTRFTGTITIQWVTFDTTNPGTVVQQSTSVDVANGLLQVQLVPNSTAAPPANVYTVHYQSDASQQFTETWTVPAGTTPLTVAQVRTGIITSGGTGTAPGTTVTESSVVGLLSDLAQRPVKGPGFGTTAVAVINQNGQIDAAVGDVGMCVLVDGTAGPCGVTSQFFDAETPGGVVDGVNTAFTLANSPSGTSLSLFLNGLYLSAGFDYTLNGSAITFTSGAQPQPGDTLIASYRIDPLAGNIGALHGGSPTVLAQVICSANGTSANSATFATLGTCAIPSADLKPGDRFEVRFSFTHTGTASGYNVQINWGNTTVLLRQAGQQDTAFAGQADAAISASGAQLTLQSYGTVLSFRPSIVSAPAQNGLSLAFQSALTAASSDMVALTSYTVLRYPAH